MVGWPSSGISGQTKGAGVGAMAVRIVITGGTFDKHYDEIRGQLTSRDTHLPEILRDVRCTVPVELELDQLIDSLDMGPANRQRILDSCRRAPEAGTG